jgi:hypothetical protein
MDPNRAALAPLALLLAFFIGVQAGRASSYVSANLGLLTDGLGDPKGLTNRLTGTNWLTNTSSMFGLSGGSGLSSTVSYAVVTNTGEIQVTLTMTNPTASAIAVAPTFPDLSGLNPGGNYSTFYYCFPQMGDLCGTSNKTVTRYYGGDFPMQFMDLYDGTAGGIYIMSHDLSDSFRTYTLTKTATNATLSVAYASQTIPAGGSWVLSAVIGAHTGDWHAALAAYRSWVATWYAPLVPRHSWFQDVYNLREMFLYTNTAIGDTPAYNPTSQTYVFNSLLAQDAAAFGGIDYVHLFDWSQTPSGGRVGDYNPWSYLGGAAAFSNQLAAIQSGGSPVGLYFEGYLISTQSTIGQSSGATWELLNSSEQTYTSMGANYYYACPDVPAWTNYLAGKVLGAISNCAPAGIYLDEFGFGWQYPCYNSSHPHTIPSQQVQAEGAMMRQLRLALPASNVLYSEERNTDVNSQYQDGSFTYCVSQTDTNNNPSAVDLPRFALPDYKVFEIISLDAPLGNNPRGVLATFFNGEGIWLEGPLNSTWFPSNICALITQTHAVLRQYADAFRGTNPAPLVPTLNSNLYANEFPGANRTVWTLYNASSQTLSGELLAVTNKPNYRYYDAWNNQFLTPRISGTNAYLTLAVAPGGAGCVVQEDYRSLVLANNPAGYWRLDEANTGAGKVATNWGSLGTAANGVYSQGVTGGAAGAISSDSDTAASFNGVTGNIQVPFNAALNTSTFSIECWAKPNLSAPGSYMGVISASTNYALYAMPGVTNGSWAFWTGNGAGWNIQAGSLLLSNQWAHLVGTYDGTNQNFYVDGVLVASAPQVYAPQATNALLIGAGGVSSSPAYFFSGVIDEVAFYTNVLSEANVAAHYAIGAPPALGFQQQTNTLLLNWTGGALQQATQLSGPWSNVVGAVPPFQIVPSTTNALMLFRVKQ